ncbi:hypothetical protein ACFYNY_36250 [Streptomyces sp. NPDC006530]|uniref:hypothetical protein n=1 Tax=Streptomyces sp. NPDC006530 TaxID=3364750 RepID=UPI0036A99635
MSTAERAVEETAETAPERPHLELVRQPGRIAVLRSELRPYLPTPRNLTGPMRGVGAGSLVLLSRGWTWVWAEGIQDGAMRAGGAVLAGYAAVNTAVVMAGPFLGYVVPAAVVGWCAVAKHHAPAAPAEKVVEAADEDQDDAPVEEFGIEDGDVLEVDEVAALIREIAGRHDHQGAHLDDLLAEPDFEGWEKGELKAALVEDWGLPVESFKLMFGGRQRVRDGVRLRHLPAPLRAVPTAAGEGPLSGPQSTPLSAVPEAPAGTGVGVPAGAAGGPSPSGPAPPSQGAG